VNDKEDEKNKLEEGIDAKDKVEGEDKEKENEESSLTEEQKVGIFFKFLESSRTQEN
jgi:hypothetical protein